MLQLDSEFSAGLQNSLWRLEVSVDDLVEVKIVHAPSNTHGPVHEQRWCDLPAGSQHLIQLSLGTVLHDNAVTWSLSTNTSKSVEKYVQYFKTVSL